MTQATSQASESAQLPTIIIDPSLYEADAPLPKQPDRSGFRRLARVTLLTGAVGGATLGIAHLLPGASLSHDFGVGLLTKWMSQPDNDAAPHAPRTAEPSTSLAEPAKSVAAAAQRVEQERSAEAPSDLAVVPPRAEPAPALAAPEAPLAAPSAEGPSAQEMPQESPDPAPKQVVPGPKRALVVAMHPPANAVRPIASTPRVDLEASIRSARRLQALNQLDEAEAAYQAVLAQSAEQSAALVGLARIKLSRGDLEAALGLARRAAAQAPEQASVHLTLGDILRARGDQQGAQAEYALAK